MEGQEEELEIEGLTLLRFMNRIGLNQFFWDKKPDILTVNNNDILLRTDPPHPVSTRYMGYSKQLVSQLDRLLRNSFVWFDFKIVSLSLKLQKTLNYIKISKLTQNFVFLPIFS